ncbi:hypothetical protein MOE21_17980 [Bacillus atrophaeus]|uniref:hypothetical protein n=1 Tax=Bacillus atrophaeus TaxID=1452 RepID=UPI00227DEAFA|nr:hypothetical protein [Bacillus atrophaeus]MCY8934470.1 hypothetical protein [Bacillus atrophaeus]
MSLESLERVKNDTENRINDGLHSNNQTYIEDQTRKHQDILDELARRKQTTVMYTK